MKTINGSIMYSRLRNAWNLEKDILDRNLNPGLRKEIDRFISKGNQISDRWGRLMYRSNLHYILDNIEKESLRTEIKEFISHN